MLAAICINNLSKIYKDRSNSRNIVKVLQNFSLEIDYGSFTVLHGPNGCGKSTLIHILAGVEKYDSGMVSVLDKNPVEANIGIIFQNYSATLFPWLNVVDNICFGLRDKNISKKNKRVLAKSFIEYIGFTDISNSLFAYPYQLSGGQQQMVAIARALSAESPVIFFDEAFSALDARHKDNALIQVQQFCKDRKITCLFAIHDLDDAILMADNLLILRSNPMQIKCNISVEFKRPRTLQLFKKTEFFDLRKKVLEIIEEED